MARREPNTGVNTPAPRARRRVRQALREFATVPLLVVFLFLALAVTSILFVAVRQTGSTLSPVVFDQFMRRRSNQASFGFFLGLTLYAHVVLVAVQNNTPPVLGAGLATVLTAGALACLLMLVCSTVNQMRPANVLRQIHDRALLGRRHETDLIRNTRRQE